MLKLSPGQINYDLQEIRRRYAAQTMHTRETHVAEIDAQLTDLLFEHWVCYKRLQRDAKKTVVREAPRPIKDAQGNPTGESVMETVEVSTTTMGRVPGAEHLKAILDVLKSKRELFGVDAPKKVDIRRLSLNLDELMKKLEMEQSAPLSIDDELAKLLGEIPNLPNADPQARSKPPIGLKELPPPSSNGTHGMNGNGQH